MRTYKLALSNATVGANTILFLNPGTASPIKVLRVSISQSNGTTAARQRVQFVRQVSAFPTLVTTGATLTKIKDGDASSTLTLTTTGAAGTCGVNASSEGAGAKTIIEPFAFDTNVGFDWFAASDDERYVLAASTASGFGVYLPAAPGTTTNWNASITWGEL